MLMIDSCNDAIELFDTASLIASKDACCAGVPLKVVFLDLSALDGRVFRTFKC